MLYSTIYVDDQAERAVVSSEGERVPSGDRLEVHQEMDCRGFIAEGKVRLIGAHVGGELSFEEQHFTRAELSQN